MMEQIKNHQLEQADNNTNDYKVQLKVTSMGKDQWRNLTISWLFCIALIQKLLQPHITICVQESNNTESGNKLRVRPLV